MKIEYGQRVRVVAAAWKPELEGEELWLDNVEGEPNAEGRFFVDGKPDDEDNQNLNDDYGYVDKIEPVMPPEFIDRNRYFMDGIRKFVLLDDPAPAVQGDDVDDKDEQEASTPERFPLGSRVVIKRAVWAEGSEGNFGKVEANDDPHVFRTWEGERVPHPYRVREDRTGNNIWAAEVELVEEPILEPEGFVPPGFATAVRSRPILTDLTTGKKVDPHWVLDRLRRDGSVEVGVQPEEPIPTTITMDDVAETAQALGLGAPIKPDAVEEDVVNHPSHYTMHPAGVECIDVVEWMSFNRGNAVKYLWRAGQKDPAREVEDLEKARWCIDREIDRIRRTQA